MKDVLALAVLGVAVAVPVYAYAGYPLLLRILAILKSDAEVPRVPDGQWPFITLSIPAYNEEAVISDTLENLLQVDYPRERMQILVLSDASTDGTDEIVRGFADRGVELLRMPRRVGKTEAENSSHSHVRGEIIVNTDASVRIARDGLKPLIAAFSLPSVGVASGSDVSIGVSNDANVGESSYVGYEMSVRDLETSVDGIVGASGCYYAILRDLHATTLPPSLSRDFAAALVAREAGYRAVSVPRALCFVPRTGDLRSEYRRKVRTIARGLRTLAYKRSLLKPWRYGVFSWMLFSHKLCRWLVPWAAVAGLGAIALLATDATWARWVLGLAAIAGLLSLLGFRRTVTKAATPLSLLAFFAVGNLAVLHAWLRALAGDMNPAWEPTRRPATTSR